ncbi:induced during hyphae development protein 1-like [Camellia sinensis]|uniref:induced during hyphae development protein 1-like n=1 Tax=Camellia sinensis TaxID=4442 RepID=UPI0010367CED|nr:induced during hyphae development protein 1-like [Camellia sinensis]
MPPLVDVHGHTERAIDIASSSRARAADAPSASRTHAVDAPSTSRAQPSIEYVEGLLEVMASFEGMILRREMMLNSHGIQVTPLQTGPSEPSLVVGREILARSRGRGREPVVRNDDDKTSEDEEPASPQSESSKGGGDDIGSGFEGGDDAEEGSKDGSGGSSDSGSGSSSDSNSSANGDSSKSAQLRKRTKRASRS